MVFLAWRLCLDDELVSEGLIFGRDSVTKLLS